MWEVPPGFGEQRLPTGAQSSSQFYNQNQFNASVQQTSHPVNQQFIPHREEIFQRPPPVRTNTSSVANPLDELTQELLKIRLETTFFDRR